MDIGIISSRYPVGPKHDAGRAVHSFAHGLAASGHKVTVYTYNGSKMTMKYLEAKNLRVVSIGVIATIPIKSGLIYEDTEMWNLGIWDEISHEDTTKVLLVFDWFGFQAALLHREMYKSSIVGVVGSLANGRGQFIPFTDKFKLEAFKEKELEFLSKSDYLVAFNKCSASEVGKLTDVPCEIVPAGIQPLDIALTPILTTTGNVLVVGRLSREKVLEALLRAIRDNMWVELTLCGTGQETDYGKYIVKLSHKLEIANRVSFTESLPDYSKAEMVVCPSVYDPFGYTVYDAFNNCVPVIAHYMSYSDMIKNKDTGYCYQSVGDLSKAMNLLHHSKSLRRQLAMAGKAELLQSYTITKSMETMDHLLLNLTQGVCK